MNLIEAIQLWFRVLVVVLFIGGPKTAPASDKHQHRGPEGPIRVTDAQIHDAGGVPSGWRFRIPNGNAAVGRAVFIKMECFRCHNIRGENFPVVDQGPKDAGPELTGIGSEGHPPEFLAESIVNPNRVILIGEGYTGVDGSSAMPSYADLMSVEELFDLTAYLMSLERGLGVE